MPCSVAGESAWVLALLSAASAPIALRMEVWQPDEGNPDALVRIAGFCEYSGTLPTGPDATHPIRALGPIGKSWCTAVAQAEMLHPAVGTPVDQQAMRAAGIGSVLALPVMDGAEVSEVVALYF